MSFLRICLLLALPCIASAHAGTPPAAPADSAWRQAFAAAWQRYPGAAGIAAEEAEARASADVAGAPTPEPGSIAVGSRNDRFGRRQGQQEYEVELAAPLWLPGQRAAHADEASGRAALVAARQAARQLALAGEIRAAGWALVEARQTLALAVRRLASARQLEADVRRRHEAGDLSRIDANLARAETHAAEGARLDAESALHAAEQAWRTLTGQAPPAELGEEAPAAGPNGLPDVLARHPRIVEAMALVRATRARFRVAAETRRAAPELALRLVRERGDFAEPYASSVGVKLTIPFSSGAQVRRETSAAQAEADIAEAELQRTRRQVELELARVRQAVPTAERQLAMARERQALAADNLQLAEKAFALGETDLATLLRIRTAAFDADALAERQRAARAAAIARLNQAMGALP